MLPGQLGKRRYPDRLTHVFDRDLTSPDLSVVSSSFLISGDSLVQNRVRPVTKEHCLPKNYKRLLQGSVPVVGAKIVEWTVETTLLQADQHGCDKL